MFWKDPVNESELITQVKQKLAGRKANTLSRARTLTLVQSNITGMPNHVMSCLKFPNKLTAQLNCKCRNFFSGETE